MLCWDIWFKHWDIVTRVGKELSMSEEEIKASVKELMKVFGCDWVESNRKVHHFSYYIEHPEALGHVLELLPLGYGLYILGGVERVPKYKISQLKDPKEWDSIYYELCILAQVKKKIERRDMVLVLPESIPELRKKGLSRLPDGIVLDREKRYLYWVEVKYLRSIPKTLTKLSEYSRKMAEALTAEHHKNKAVIIEITTEALSEVLRAIGEESNPIELKRIVQTELLKLLDEVSNVVKTRELSSQGLYNIKMIQKDVKRVEELDTVKYKYATEYDKIVVGTPKGRDFGPLIRKRVSISMPVPLLALLVRLVNYVRVINKLRKALRQVPNELRLPRIIVLGPALPSELGKLGLPFVSELEVQKALERLKIKVRKSNHLNIIKEVWIHMPDLKKYVHVPAKGNFRIIEL